MTLTGRFWGFWRKVWSPYESLDQGAVRGGVLTFLSRFFIKGASFIKTIIIARILFPEDFGMFGLASVALGIFDLFQPGFNAAIVQEKGDVKKYLHSVWTANILRHTFFALVIVGLAPLYAEFFQTPELTNLVRALALSVFLTGFENTGIILIQKDLLFRRKFFLDVALTVSEVIIVVISAFVLKSVWALVLGSIGNRIAAVVFSFLLHPFRPSLEFNWGYIRHLFQYGKWLWGLAIISFLMSRADTLVLGKMLTTEAIGYYQLAFGLALLPSVELARVLNNVLFPYFAKIQDNFAHLLHAFTENIRVVFALVLPISFGFFALGHEFVAFFYGARWAPMGEIAMVVIVLGLVRTLEYLINSVVQGAGKPDISTKSLAIQAVVTFGTIVPFIDLFGIFGAVYAHVLGCALAQCYGLVVVRGVFGQSISGVFSAMGYALIPSVLMFCGIEILTDALGLSGGHALLVGVPLGGVIYVTLLYALDRVFGRKLATTLRWIRTNV